MGFIVNEIVMTGPNFSKFDGLIETICKSFKDKVDNLSTKPMEKFECALAINGVKRFLYDIESYFQNANIAMTERARADVLVKKYSEEELDYICDKIAKSLGTRVRVSREIRISKGSRVYNVTHGDVKTRIVIPFKLHVIKIEPVDVA